MGKNVGRATSDIRPIRTKSGQQMTRQELIDLVKDVIRSGIRTGIREVVKIYNVHVAKDTGALRARLENMLLNQVTFIGDATRINMKFDMAEMKKLFYAEYHIDGKPYGKGDVSPYRNPTTAGTRPIQRKEIMGQIAERTKEEIRKGLRSYGLL